jgi:hypothetical protein
MWGDDIPVIVTVIVAMMIVANVVVVVVVVVVVGTLWLLTSSWANLLRRMMGKRVSQGNIRRR